MKKIQYLLATMFYFVSINSAHFILIAAPGSGKGTFSQYMTKKYGYIQICPGDIFRKEILLQTQLGKIIQPIVEAGDYVDEKTVCTLMEKYIEKALDQNKLLILDGFPRSEHSLQFLLELLTKKEIINNVCFLQLQASDEICKQRILGRFVCNECGYVDNKAKMNSNQNPTCNACGAKLALRAGDKEAIVDKRLQHFHTVIEPLIQKLEANNYPVKKINSNQDLSNLERIYNEIVS